MAKKPLKERINEHWHGLRYHMEAGLIWYILGFVNYGMVTETFNYFSSHIGS